MQGTRDSSIAGVANVAAAVGFLMIAHQVSAKATRDALFLSNFDVTSLPTMLIAAAVVSMVVVLGVSRAMTSRGPYALVPGAFGASAVLLVVEWLLSNRFPRAVSLAVYFHIAVFGSILVSGFWSLINERFDPRTGKKLIGRIATGGSIGGLAGGLLAERVAVLLSTGSMLPILGALHCACAAILFWVTRTDQERNGSRVRHSAKIRSRGTQVVARQPYLRILALLVLLSTVGATLIDYVFKAQASGTFTQSESLLRFFAIYYTAAGLLTVLLQGGVSRILLQRLGAVKTAATLPAVTSLTAFGAFLFPGLWTVTAARGSEAVLKNSLYRSSYELLYTPVPADEKRAAKSLIDVGCERLGDALGGGILRLILLIAAGLAQSVMLFLAVLFGLVCLVLAKRLGREYIRTLERNLKNRALELDDADLQDPMTRTMVLNLESVKSDPLQSFVSNRAVALGRGPESTRPQRERIDPLTEKFTELRSRDRERIRKVLSAGPLESPLIPVAIHLLAKDDLAPELIRFLRRQAEPILGQLTDALVDQSRPEAVRRRVPRVMGGSATQRAAEGLLLGLNDPRFEVRFQCGRALAYITEQNSQIEISRERVFSVVLREVHVKQAVWEGQRLLDQIGEEDSPGVPFLDDLVKDRAGRSLEHVFSLLALVLPREPLGIAYRGLHTRDRNLRGTSLEYLESVLPPEIRSRLWPFLEWEEAKTAGVRTREEVLRDLINSDQSIQLSLEELRRMRGEGN